MGLLNRLHPQIKLMFEWMFWKYQKNKQGKLKNDHYKPFYTSYFGLDEKFYQGKCILDIGCGPRGSLEWAKMAKARIGIDPLADKYKKLGASGHEMGYVKGNAEKMAFDDAFFDVVCSFNSLDHVDDLSATCSEIKRVLKKGGLFLLIVDIHHKTLLTEPQSLKWNFTGEYFSEFEVMEEKHLQVMKKGFIYTNVRAQIEFKGDKRQTGILTAKLRKK